MDPSPCAVNDYPCQQVQLLTSINVSCTDIATQVHILHGGIEFVGLLLSVLIFVNIAYGVIGASQRRRGQ